MNYKPLLLWLVFVGYTLSGIAQDDRGFSYQAVARDASGGLLANTSVNLRFYVLEDSPTGTTVYQETHAPTTNDFGLFVVSMGKGSIETGVFSAVDWASADHYLIVELNGTKIDTTLFEAVPYSKVATAMYVKDLVDVKGTPANGEILKWNGSDWVPSVDETEDADADPTNELQTLSLSGTDLSISNGNSVSLPSFTAGTGIDITGGVITNTGDTDASDDIVIGTAAGGDLSGTYPNPTVIGIQGYPVENTAPISGHVLKWNGMNWRPAPDDDVDGDSDPANELQTLSISGTTLSLSDGNSVSVPGSLWSENGNDIYFNSGNVGIGTTSPQYPLQVALNDDVVFGNNLTTTGAKFFYNSNKGALQIGNITAATSVDDSMGLYTLAQGFQTLAPGLYAASFNSRTAAYGNLSFVAGLYSYSDTYLQATFGRYSERYSGPVGSWVDTDPLFVVANGSSFVNQNNAFTILKNGKVGINDASPFYLLDIENEDMATRSLYIDHNSSGSSLSAQYGIFLDLDQSNSSNTSPVYGSYTDVVNFGGTAYGVYALGSCISSGSAFAYGVRAIGNNDNGTGTVYGIYASFFPSTSSGPEYAGYFQGDVYTSGTYLPSDAGLKTNIAASGSVLNKLLALDIKTYSYQRDTYPDMNLPKGLRTGFLAQDVAQLMPELVTEATSPAATPEEREKGATQAEDVHFQAVDYAGMVPYLVKAIQEQQAQIEALKAEIELLKQD